jgi:hypothetical protein
VPPSPAPYDAVGARGDVDVEIDVDLGGPQDNAIQLVDGAAAVERIGVERGANLDVVGIDRNRLDSVQVKPLHVQEFPEDAFVHHVHRARRDAAQDEAASHSRLFHHLTNKPCRGEGRAAGTGLE